MSVAMTATGIITNTATTAAHTIIYQFSDAKKEEMAEKLFGILQSYKASVWCDELSNRLREWSLIILDPDNPISDEKVAIKVNELWQILNNFITDGALKIPYTDRGWVWDKQYLDCYLNYSKISPFDGKEIDAKPHDFAQKMIEWVQMQPTAAFQKEVYAKETAVTVAGPLFGKDYLPMIYIKAQAEMVKQSERQQRLELITRLAVKERVIALIQKQTDELIETTRKLNSATTAEMKQKLEESQKIQQSNMQLLKDELTVVRQTVESAEYRLALANSHAKVQEDRINTLQNKFNQLEEITQELQRTKKGDSGCWIM